MKSFNNWQWYWLNGSFICRRSRKSAMHINTAILCNLLKWLPHGIINCKFSIPKSRQASKYVFRKCFKLHFGRWIVIAFFWQFNPNLHFLICMINCVIITKNMKANRMRSLTILPLVELSVLFSLRGAMKSGSQAPPKILRCRPHLKHAHGKIYQKK